MRNPKPCLLTILFLLCGRSSLQAQSTPVCDIIGKAAMEAILNSPLSQQSQENGATCFYSNNIPNQPRPAKAMNVSVRLITANAPDRSAVDQFLKRIDENTYDDPTVVADYGDAAFWFARPGSGDLAVFSGGKTLLHIQNVSTQEQARTIAAKIPGATTRTGFVYGTPGPFQKPVLGTRPAKPTQIEQLKFDLTGKAETGSAKAQFALGNFYEYGMVGPDGIARPDYPAASYWYQMASDRGEPAASFALALIYAEGRGIMQDNLIAHRLYQRAAMSGFTPAMIQLSYSYGIVKMETSLNHAQTWAKAAAAAGDPEGDVMMGYLWNKGYLLPPGANRQIGYQNAMQLFLKAANAGDCVAMMNIGGLYFNGDGVPQDKNQAQAWFAKAQSCGGANLDWMRDKAAKYQQRAANGKLPAIPTPPPGEPLVKLGTSIMSMMSLTLGFDVMAADSEDKMKNLNFLDVMRLVSTNGKSACVLSGLPANLGLPPSIC